MMELKERAGVWKEHGLGTCGKEREREKGDGETRERYGRDRQERDKNVQRTESAGDKQSREKARQM